MKFCLKDANCDTAEKRKFQSNLKEQRVVFRYSLVDRNIGLQR